jgi:hypothetical protein
MSIGQSRLIRFPAPASSEDYATAAEELEDALLGLPGAIAVYRLGNVSAPGISDIDRIVVVESGARCPAVWPRLSERTRSIAMHAPFLVDSATFARHSWFTHLEPLELASGDALSVEVRPVPEYSEPLMGAEAMVLIHLKIAKQALTSLVKVRPLLCELHNLRHDLALAGIDSDQAPRGWALAEAVRQVRERWWSLSAADQIGRVRALLGQAETALAESLSSLPKLDGRPLQLQLRLGAEWRNVNLVAGETQSFRPGLAQYFRISRRATEASWRLRTHTVRLPAHVISLLVRPPSSTYDEFWVRRRAVVVAYRNFLQANPGHAGIGSALVFLGHE